MKKFHITITNNETGETCIDIDTKVIIGAINNDEGTQVLCASQCNAVELSATCAGALQAVNHGIEGLPKPLRKKVQKLGKITRE